jgi:methyltransferase (TIGR00027 family)
MIIVAAEQHEPSPLVHDPCAQRLLPLSDRIAAGTTRWSPARRALIATTEKKLRGGWASFLCRKRYIDDQLVNAVVKGIDAVVILGAGYDTRAYRLPELVGPDEYADRYFEPAGRTLTASEIERAVYAER